MYLVEILLPMNDNSGRPFGAEKYAAVRGHLMDRFGGLTAFTRSPAQGAVAMGKQIVLDDIVVFEVMTEELDMQWWSIYRLHLETEFRQDDVVIRASAITLL